MLLDMLDSKNIFFRYLSLLLKSQYLQNNLNHQNFEQELKLKLQ